MSNVTRRQFVEGTGKTAAGVGIAMTAASSARAAGSNEKIRLALIGCGGRGSYVARGLIEAGAAITHLCDVNPSKMDRVWKFLSSAQKQQPKFVADMQHVFDDKDVDGVIIATPDHWHALGTIRACEAGKDVYVEKPHSINIWESQKMVEAARKHKRVVQVGTQNRSVPYAHEAREYIKSGKLGDIPLVRVFNMKDGGEFKLGESTPQPEGFDWNLWLGPASQRPFHSKLIQHGWLYYWDFAGGDMLSDGIHQLDLALMLMGDPPLPKSVRSLGGKYAYPDADAERPDVQTSSWDYGNFILEGENTGYPRYMRKTTLTIRRNDELPYWTQNATRIEIYGKELMMTVGRHGGGWIVQTVQGRLVEKQFGRVPDPWHYDNFLSCMRSRQRPNADIEIAHNANAVVHMSNIAHRLGNIGLNYDRATGRFDNERANAMLKGPYRKGFEIPDTV